MWPQVYMCKDQKHLGGPTDITRKWRVWRTQAACECNSHEVIAMIKMNTHASDSLYSVTAFKGKITSMKWKISRKTIQPDEFICWHEVINLAHVHIHHVTETKICYVTAKGHWLPPSLLPVFLTVVPGSSRTDCGGVFKACSEVLLSSPSRACPLMSSVNKETLCD